MPYNATEPSGVSVKPYDAPHLTLTPPTLSSRHQMFSMQNSLRSRRGSLKLSRRTA